MKKIKILIVEDETLIALSLKSQLLRAGYEVCTLASTAKQAIDIVLKEAPDFVLIDIRLPGDMDGIEAARQIGACSTAQIIFASGYSDPALQQSAMSVHPAAYLIKPVDVDDIESVVRSIKLKEEAE
ncbi:MAG TPA: response regulator [bacterium]|nr:response regulator [bacterium]HPN45890.1 response regulator [bacterium]